MNLRAINDDERHMDDVPVSVVSIFKLRSGTQDPFLALLRETFAQSQAEIMGLTAITIYRAAEQDRVIMIASFETIAWHWLFVASGPFGENAAALVGMIADVDQSYCSTAYAHDAALHWERSGAPLPRCTRA